MTRHSLTDEQWHQIQDLLPARPGPKSKRGDRLFVNAVVYRARTGVPWRDLPSRFGPWKTVFNRFDKWSKRGVWEDIFKALQVDVDPTCSMVDASVVRAHQDSSGGKGGSNTMLWDALEEVFRPRCTPSSTGGPGRCT